MPELPEVETICRGLRSRLPGRKVIKVEVHEPRLRSTINGDFGSRLLDRTILDVGRRGKYLLLFLAGGQVWVSHLGMSGKLIHVEGERPREKHDHIIVGLDSGCELRYHDPRRFGLSLVVAHDELQTLSQLHHLGLDPFDRRFNGQYLYSATRRSRRRIRDVLIDQRVVAGVGNIYANEILFRVGIRPATRAFRLARIQVGRIAGMTPRVLREAIRWCGTSISDYRDAEDGFGEFQKYLRVYNREGEKCRACPSKIKRFSLGNRGAFYCPSCQS